MKLSSVGVGLILAGGAAWAGQAWAQTHTQMPVLSMTCHELFRGVPMAEGSIYELVGRDLCHRNSTTRIPISSQGAPVFLDKVREKDGTFTESFASHVVNGPIIERTVYWKRAGGDMKEIFKERYDFKARTIIVSNRPGDICHADGR